MLLLHIGRGKAGSTTIQNGVASNQTLLATHGIVVPDASKKYGGNYAPLALTLHSKSFDNSPVLDEFSKMLEQNPDRKIFVSSEFLFGLPPHAISVIRDMARGHQVQLLAYLREYPGWFQSLYGQSTRTGKNLANFDSFFDRSWKHCFAATHLSNWADVFGWENIRVRSLDRACLTGGTLLNDLSSVLGVTLRETPIKNVSLHWIEIEFLRELYNADHRLRSNVSFKKDLRIVCDRLRECIDAGEAVDARYLSSEQWSQLADLYAEEAMFIGEKMGIVIPPQTMPAAARPFLPTLAEAPRSLCARFLEQGGTSGFLPDCHPIVRDAVAAVVAAWDGTPLQKSPVADEKSLSDGLASL